MKPISPERREAILARLSGAVRETVARVAAQEGISPDILANVRKPTETSKLRHTERWNGRRIRNRSSVRSTTLNPVSRRSPGPIAKRAG
jgi:hypothetical protein